MSSIEVVEKKISISKALNKLNEKDRELFKDHVKNVEVTNKEENEMIMDLKEMQKVDNKSKHIKFRHF